MADATWTHLATCVSQTEHMQISLMHTINVFCSLNQFPRTTSLLAILWPLVRCTSAICAHISSENSSIKITDQTSSSTWFCKRLNERIKEFPVDRLSPLFQSIVRSHFLRHSVVSYSNELQSARKCGNFVWSFFQLRLLLNRIKRAEIEVSSYVKWDCKKKNCILSARQFKWISLSVRRSQLTELAIRATSILVCRSVFLLLSFWIWIFGHYHLWIAKEEMWFLDVLIHIMKFISANN